jgi:hypothetical protein
MNKRSIRYRDTWAAPGSQLHAALEDGNKPLAEKIYAEWERDRAKLEGSMLKRIDAGVKTGSELKVLVVGVGTGVSAVAKALARDTNPHSKTQAILKQVQDAMK